MPHKGSSWKKKLNPALMPCIEVIVTILDAATAAEEHFLREHFVRISSSDYKSFKIFYNKKLEGRFPYFPSKDR
jgi:hypothetical protein